VTAVVVSHNTRGCLEKCVSELTGLGLATIVVDTASTDASIQAVHRRFPQVETIELAENRGFGAAANDAISRVGTPYVLLLNADAWPHGNPIPELVAIAEEEPRLAAIAPALLNAEGTPQRSVFGYPTSPVRLAAWAAFPRPVSLAFRGWRKLAVLRSTRRDHADDDRYELVGGNDFTAGAALLLRKEAFDEVGGFDERFFMYSEETDLCWRLRDVGWLVAYYPRAHFIHIGGASAAQQRDEMYREQLGSYLRFMAKHSGARTAERARRLTAVSLRLRAAIPGSAARRRYREAAAWLESGRAVMFL
jgi:GT2 family glycosyltransferase